MPLQEFIRLKVVFANEEVAMFAIVDEDGTEYTVDALLYCVLRNLRNVGLLLYQEEIESGTRKN